MTGAIPMISYDFSLSFRLPDSGSDPEQWLGAIVAAGCDDATVGVGRLGRIALDFTRAARSAGAAMKSAVADVTRAIPGAELIEVAPDYAGVADIAEVMGVSRQRVRALIDSKAGFPLPVHEGSSALYHLAPVLEWLERNEHRTVAPAYLETARAAMRLNVAQSFAMAGR